MLLEIKSSCPIVSSVALNWSSAKLHKFYKKVSVTKSLLKKTVNIHAVSLETYSSASTDTISGGFLWIHLCQNIFLLLHFMRIYVVRCSTKYMLLKIPQNSQEISFTRLSWLRRKPFSENILKFLGTLVLKNISERLLLISIPSLYRFKTFLFWNRSIFVLFQTTLGYIKIHVPHILGLHNFST